jgi:hypothetical protein
MTEDRDHEMYCRRCKASVEVIRPWRGWKGALYSWYGTMALLVILFPFMASDFCVMIPTMMALILAGSPLHRLAKETPACTVCSLELPWDATRKSAGPRP